MIPDVLVLGAGPAGCVVSRRLAKAGARVMLVGAAARPGWEGLSARSQALLTEEGAGTDAHAGGDAFSSVIAGPFPRGGVWADRAVEGFEWLVERRQLAKSLRSEALSAGVDYRFDAVTHAVCSAGLWRVRLHSGGRLEAPVLVDARGRRGAERRGPVLLALGQTFRRQRSAASGTEIRAFDAGWCWWATRGRALWVQVVSRPHSRHPAGWIAAAAAQVPALAQALEGATPDGDAVARPAHARLGIARHLGLATHDSTPWRVGDAALALDPLSGQGVYEALRGAGLVATAIQSVLNGGDAEIAHRFVSDRQVEAWIRGVRVAAGFYREYGERSDFWARTAAGYEQLLADAAPVALGTLRRAVLHDGRILEREVIVTADHPRGVWQVDGVPLVPLKGYLESAKHSTVAGAAEALEKPEAAVAAAIHWLQRTGVVSVQFRQRDSSGG